MKGLSVLLVGLFFFTPFYGGAEVIEHRGTVFYISPQGNDAWSGRFPEPEEGQKDGPFATLEAARDAIRQLKREKRLRYPVTVYLRGGIYFLKRPIVFGPEDSGTKKYPIRYLAYPGETPVVSGGRLLQGWKRGEGKLWVLTIPEVKEGKEYYRQLFVNGERRTRARIPNKGFYRMEGEISTEDPAQFQFRPGDIKKEWAERGDVEIVGLAKWAEFRHWLRKVEEETHTATLSGKIHSWIREPNERYWIENVFEGLNSPGEWYLDRRTGLLYYWPLPQEDMEKAEVIVPRLPQLVIFEGDFERKKPVQYITLKGLTFSHTDWTLPEGGYADVQAAFDIPAAIQAKGAVSLRIEGCTFIHLGNYAVEFSRGCRYNRIDGNEMTDLGAGGVKIGEPQIRSEDFDLTFGNQVVNNHIYNIGIVYPAAVGVWVGQSSENRIAHNHIHDTYYTGISVGWTWGYGPTNAKGNIIEYNHVHHIGRGLLSDMGAVYTLGVQPGTVIRNNLFHDINAYDYGGWGIYPDEGSSHLLIEKNIVYNTKTGGFHQHYGRENIVRNNIFALAKTGQIIRTRSEPHLSFIFERNIVYWKEGPLLGGNWEGDQYRLDYNLYFNASGVPIRFGQWSFEEWQARGQDIHSLIADPLFLAPEEGDFRLKRNSPAFKLGFQPIDVSRVGPRKKVSTPL